MAKKITAIVSLSLISLIIIATIVLINVNVNHNIKYNKPNEIWVTYDGGVQTQIEDEAKINKILKIMKNETKENMLTAIFNGTVNKKPKLVTQNSTSVVPDNNDYYLIFSYSNPQKLEGEEEVYYYDLIFTISNTNGAKEIKVFISEDGSLNYKKYYTIEVDYSSIYNYLNDLGYNK